MSDEFGWCSEDDTVLVEATTAASNGKRNLESDMVVSQTKIKRKRANTNLDTKVSPNTELARRVLKERFGLNSFRLEQEAVVTRLLDGGSAVVVFPTGGGKSLCYQVSPSSFHVRTYSHMTQVPAVAFKFQDQNNDGVSAQNMGVSLVISPLIALMKDQVDALLRRGIKAAVLNSTLTRDQFLQTQDDLRNGRLDLIYCAPERLNNEGFITSLKGIPGGIQLLAIDEAHCISEWGHSFRPDYLKIARFAQEANVQRVVCLTATATEKVAEDIRHAFAIPAEGLFRTTMYRPNLRLLAEANPKGTNYIAKLVSHLKKYPGPTIIYVTLQKGAVSLAEELKNRGFSSKPYHAGMPHDLRTKTQDEFLLSKNMVVVATIAFGMGIDKADIRNIVHFDIPDSIESYSQQIGRAGRDGKPSVCMFYLSTKDFHLRNIFTYGARPSTRSLRLLLQDICSPANRRLMAGETFKVSLYSQSKEDDIDATTLGIIYAQLELHYKLFRAVGTLYSEYKYIVKDPTALSKDPSPASTAIRKAAVKATKWTHISVDDVATTASIDRATIVSKLTSWNEQGIIDLKTQGVQNIYKLQRPLPKTTQEINDIIQYLDESMGATEQMNIARTQALIHLITGETCFSRALAGYFGETPLAAGDDMPSECGHCTWCETHTQVELPKEPYEPPDMAKVKQILDKVNVRDDPRLLAKVAFGIKSPRITALKVAATGVFESMNVCGFGELLEVFGKVCDGSTK